MTPFRTSDRPWLKAAPDAAARCGASLTAAGFALLMAWGAVLPSNAVALNTDPPSDDAELILTPAEVSLARELSPVPSMPSDPTNAVADDPRAARFGQALFFDTRLSGPGDVACVTCHQPDLGFGDGRPVAMAISEHTRHSMTLWNVGYQRWFFWDGRKDSLWSQALAPFEDPREHGTSRLGVLHVVAEDPAYKAAFEELFGPLPDLRDGARFPDHGRPVPDDDEHPHAVAWNAMEPADRQAVDQSYASIGKAIAAYERLLVSSASPFDAFVRQLGDRPGGSDGGEPVSLSPSAQRGFSLFVGRGQCLVCHDGALFTDLEFHSNRLGAGAHPDPGRAKGIIDLRADPFNSASAFADDDGRTGRTRMKVAPKDFHIPGDYKTPSLRNVAVTAPYMHDGRFATLEDVIDFYSTLEDAAPMHPGGETIVQPRHFTDGEKADLLAFLRSLTDTTLDESLKHAPDGF